MFPTIVFLFISYTISGLIMSVYSMACDTILHCFLADEELMAKDGQAPQHAPTPLIEFMGREREPEHTSRRCCSC